MAELNMYKCVFRASRDIAPHVQPERGERYVLRGPYGATDSFEKILVPIRVAEHPKNELRQPSRYYASILRGRGFCLERYWPLALSQEKTQNDRPGAQRSLVAKGTVNRVL